MSYKFLPHTADIKFKTESKSLADSFKDSANALIETIISNSPIRTLKERKIEIKSKSEEMLLYEFLEEIIYLLEAKNFITSKIKSIKITNNDLKAILVGDLSKNYDFTNQVKAITFSQLNIKKEKNMYSCTVVLDI